MLGFVTVERGPGRRHPNVYRLSTRWQSIDADEAKRLRAQVHLPKPRAPQPVRPRSLKRQAPSLPRIVLRSPA